MTVRLVALAAPLLALAALLGHVLGRLYPLAALLS